MRDTAIVKIWNKEVGKIIWEEKILASFFVYNEKFLENGFDLSPFIMKRSMFNFPFKSEPYYEAAFKNLLPLFSDSLPDDFGNTIFKAYLEKTKKRLNPVERLLYVGKRGMGALEYEPMADFPKSDETLSIEYIVEALRKIINRNYDEMSEDELLNIIKYAGFAGGARAKIIVAMDNDTKDLKDGGVIYDGNFSYWLVKLDGVVGEDNVDANSYPKIEYAYYQMAKAAGIEMSDSFLLSENNRNHFFTKRFDRTDTGEKVHMLTLAGLRGFNFKTLNANSYEDIFDTIRMLELDFSAIEQQYLRAIFNIIARNQDDHVKNVSFLMDKSGNWRLAPAYDVTYAYNPDGYWTQGHQLVFNDKTDDFTRSDLIDFGKKQGISNPKRYIERVTEAVSQWGNIAKELEISKDKIEAIGSVQRLYLGMKI